MRMIIRISNADNGWNDKYGCNLENRWDDESRIKKKVE